MREVKIKKYFKKFDYSYAMGFLSTIEILRAKPEKVIKVIFSSLAGNFEESRIIKQLCSDNKINFEVNEHLIEKVAFRNNTYVLTVFNKYDSQVEHEQNHVVLVNPTDAGNVGTIIRAMYAFDINNLVLIKPAVDVFDPKVISTTTGTLFRVNTQYFNSFEEYKNKFPEINFYPFILEGKKTLEEVTFTSPYGLIFGNEAHGLGDQFDSFENTVVIKHSHKIDSLNLAMSVGIALYKSYTKNMAA